MSEPVCALRPVLITAGATRNAIDRMRHIAANSTGQTGVSIAAALSDDRPVHLLGSPEALLRGWEALSSGSLEEFSSTRDLMARMERWVRAHPQGVVVHAAAVGDYEVEPFDGKIESGRPEWTLTLRPTPKIADHLRTWGPELRIATFKAAPPETSREELLEIARKQLRRTRSDIVFANVLGRLAQGILLVEEHQERWIEHRGPALMALLEWIALE